MNLSGVIEDLVYDKGLDKDRVLDIVCKGIEVALTAKNPDLVYVVKFDETKEDNLGIFIKKTIVDEVENNNLQISVQKAKQSGIFGQVGSEILIPYQDALSRVDILKSRGYISEGIRRLEQSHIYEIFKDKVGDLVTGTVYRAEAYGFVVNLGETLAFLPASCAVNPNEIKVGGAVKSIIRDVLPYSEKGSQVVLDRSGSDYVEKVFELEIPEIFEGLVEIVKSARIAGYKTKMIVRSNAKNVDPVGSCVGLQGSRIKPILNELGGERIDLIPWVEDKGLLLQRALKSKGMTKEISRVHFSHDGLAAEVWVDVDQKSSIIGKNGGNVSLASKLLDINIKIFQEEPGIS